VLTNSYIYVPPIFPVLFLITDPASYMSFNLFRAIDSVILCFFAYCSAVNIKKISYAANNFGISLLMRS